LQRLRLTRIPKGADLILNKVARAPGFLDRQSNWSVFWSHAAI